MDNTQENQNVQATETPAVQPTTPASTDSNTQKEAEATATPTESLHEYYWSTDDKPFEPVFVKFEIDTNMYPLVKEKPEGLKSPKYDWRNGHWVENLAESVGQQVNSVKEDVKSLSARVDTMQADQQAQVKEATANDTKTNATLEGLQSMIVAINAQSGQQTLLLKELTNKINTQSSSLTTDTTKQTAETKPVATSDVKEEGAN